MSSSALASRLTLPHDARMSNKLSMPDLLARTSELMDAYDAEHPAVFGAYPDHIRHHFRRIEAALVASDIHRELPEQERQKLAEYALTWWMVCRYRQGIEQCVEDVLEFRPWPAEPRPDRSAELPGWSEGEAAT